MSEKKLLTIDEAADRLSLGRSKTRELLQAGQLSQVRVGRAVRILASSLDAYVHRLSEQSQTPTKEAVATKP